MPAWVPETDKLAEDIERERIRLAFLQEKAWGTPPVAEPVTPMPWNPAPQTTPPQPTQPLYPQAPQPPRQSIYRPPVAEPISQTQQFAPQQTIQQIAPQAIPTTKTIEPLPEPPKEKFWQRALEVFTAPFEWVDDYIIKPALAITATTTGAIPEVKREVGEDIWEWKKRSWENWKAPGIDIKVPWGDGDMRIDVKGVLEFAPWLLLPGAGQVGGASRIGLRLAGATAKTAKTAGATMRAATGISGKLGTELGTVGRYLGTTIEYSPWGLVEKTAGAAMKAGIKGVGKVTGGVSSKIGEK